MRSTLFIVAAVVGTGSLLVAQTPAEWQDVIRRLRHPDADTRLEAVRQLADANYGSAAEPVAALVLDPEDRIQAAAIDAELSFFLAERVAGFRLFSLGGSKSRAQLAFEAGPLVRVARPAPPAVIDDLITAIRDENARVRFDAVHALGFIAEPPLADAQAAALTAELDHYDPIIRAATARVLGRLRVTGASDALMTALGDSQAVVRQFALEALGRLRSPAVLTRARAMAAGEDDDLADAAFQALARVAATEDVSLFRAKLEDRRAFTRRVAAEGLGRAGDTASADRLQQMAETETADDVRLAAVFALTRLGQARSRAVAAGLEYGDGRQAEDYLFELGPAAMPGVKAAANEILASRPRARLVQLVGYFGEPSDVPAIESLLGRDDDEVRTAAMVAIERLRRRP